VSLAPFKSLRSENQIVLRSEFEEKVMHHDYVRIPVLNMYVRIIDAPALIFTPNLIPMLFRLKIANIFLIFILKYIAFFTKNALDATCSYKFSMY